jgi:hypothetical protein
VSEGFWNVLVLGMGCTNSSLGLILIGNNNFIAKKVSLVHRQYMKSIHKKETFKQNKNLKIL